MKDAIFFLIIVLTGIIVTVFILFRKKKPKKNICCNPSNIKAFKMARKFTVTFTPCSPAPVNGYKLLWREVGSTDPFNDAGNFTSSPIEIVDPDGGPDTEYEGIIQSDCGDGIFGNQVPWTTVTGSGSGSGSGSTPGYAISVRLTAVEGGADICGVDPVIKYVTSAFPAILPGVVIYDDPDCTIPHEGDGWIAAASDGVIYTLDFLTGEVGAPTGDTC